MNEYEENETEPERRDGKRERQSLHNNKIKFANKKKEAKIWIMNAQKGTRAFWVHSMMTY